MIFDHSNCVSYLKAYLKARPKAGYGEARKMAHHLGVSSTYMSHILSGAKNLTAEQAVLLSDYLGHSQLEADYFYQLVQLERAGHDRLRKFLNAKLTEIRARSQKLVHRVDAKKILSDEDRATFYSNAVYSAIHLFTSTSSRGHTPDEIAQRFSLTRARALEALRFLVEAQLVVEKDGFYAMGTQSTHLDTGSPFLQKHHSNWRLRAIQAAEDLSEEELMYTVNVSLSTEDYSRLRVRMVDFIKSFLDTVRASPAEDIACMNLDFFWIRK